MGARNSEQDQTSVVWQTVGLRLGTRGLDLRESFEPGQLAELRNARFLDERTITRRDGHVGVILQDASELPNHGGSITPLEWVYGHGQVVGETLSEEQGDHYPFPRQGKGIFDHQDGQVAWTGDRLLVVRRDDRPGVGASAFWDRIDGETLHQGIPAYLPVMDDSHPPEGLEGDYTETALTETLRVVIATDTDNRLIAWLIDRGTGSVLNRSVVADGTAIRDPRVVNSNEIPVIVWRDGGDLLISHWTGTAWTAPGQVADDVDAHDVAIYPGDGGGFVVLWRGDVSSSPTLRVGRFIGATEDEATLDFGADITPFAAGDFVETSGALALSVSLGGTLAVVWQAESDNTLHLSYYGADGSGELPLALGAAGPWDSGVTVSFRSLVHYDVAGNVVSWPIVVHASNGALYTKVWEVIVANDPEELVLVAETTRYNTKLMSKSFQVGDEVFCWLRATNSSTGYLVAGAKTLQVCGICDREVAHSRLVNDGTLAIPMVAADPLNEYAATWVRPFVTSTDRAAQSGPFSTGRNYNRPGNSLIGDLQFLPPLSAVPYGRSTALAGSLVRAWDGQELGDVGFHDYPIVESLAHADGAGSLAALGTYRYRVYPVRYNAQGERFMGAAVTSSAVTLVGTDDSVVLTINTLPLTNHDDVVFEVYRTEDGGTSYYLDGTVANDLDAETVSYTSTISDTTLITREGDSHAAGLVALSELEEFGPVGCRFLAVSGDRLWAAGGQIPRGWVHFSKLKEQNEGAGFDTLAGWQEVDTQGGEITSIVGFADGVIVFERDRIYVMGGSGPDNYGQGSFGIPQLVLSGGAVTHLGSGVCQQGVLFWGEDGPRLLDLSLRVREIHLPIRSLSSTLTPSGLTIDLARQEAIWYTEEGTALLWCYQDVTTKFGQLTSDGRWAEWTGLEIAGASQGAIITTDGVVLYEDPDAVGDNGAPFDFSGALGETAPEQVLGGHTLIRAAGIVGKHVGSHNLRFRVFFNGSPTWTDQWEWDPEDGSWLSSIDDLGGMTSAQIDAAGYTNHGGGYAFHKRTSRESCRTFRVEWSDVSAFGPTYIPYELTLELGSRGGMGRIVPQHVTTVIAR